MVRSGKPAEANIPLLRSELSQVVEHGLLRAGFAALIGGILGGFMAGALLAAFGRSRHWLGRSGNRVATSLACVAFAVSLTHLDPRSFRELEFYAHGEERRGCSPSRRKCSKPERRTRTPTTAHSTA